MSSSRASALRRPNALESLAKALASIKLAIVCLALLMVLVVLCTLAQVQLGTYGAVSVTIRSFFVYWNFPGGSFKLPVFPGGGLVGTVLFANLICAQFMRLEWTRAKAGLWLAHLGLALFFMGEFATSFFQVETMMPIEVGQTRDYTESAREMELALIDTSEADADTVYSVAQEALSRKTKIEDSRLPFTLIVKRYFPNASFQMNPRSGGEPSLATAGIGPQMEVSEQPVVTADDQMNQVAAFVEIVKGDRSLGTWLVSNGLGAPQSFASGGRSYRLAIRQRRYYLPFSLTLKEFRHEIYPGTDIPRHFSSLVRLNDASRGQDRDVVISMNQPLRYGGKAFYQASFGKEDSLSILQVVRNPGWTVPYIACVLLGLGLLLHFAMHLRGLLGEAKA